MFCILLCPTASGQWVQTNGPFGGHVSCFGLSGANLFAGIWFGGVFISADYGSNWTRVNSGLTQLSVTALAAIGTNLFAATGRGVFHSSNNGTQWTAVNGGLTDTNICALAVSGTNLFAGSSGSGVFLTTDYGTSWTPVNNGLTQLPVTALAVSGTHIFAGISGVGGGIYRSTDNGANWIPADSGFTSYSVCKLAVKGSNVFAGTTDGVFRTTNDGMNWTQVNNGLANLYVTALVAKGPDLFAGTSGFTPGRLGGVFRSTDDGASWTPTDFKIGPADVNDLAVMGTHLFAGTDYGVYHTSDDGANWGAASTGLTCTTINGIAVIDTNTYAGTDGQNVCLSTNGGDSWTSPGSPLDFFSVTALISRGSDLFAGMRTLYGYYGFFFRSTDGGATWTQPGGSGFPAYFTVTCLAHAGTSLLAGISATNVMKWETGPGVYTSTDDGLHWDFHSSGLTNTDVVAIAIADAYAFVGTAGGVFRADRAGSQIGWSWSSSGLTGLRVQDLCVSGANILAGTWTAGAFLSTDNGTSWASVDFGPGNGYAQAFAASGTHLFAATGSGVFRSSDHGLNWAPVDTSLPTSSPAILTLAASDKYLYAGTYGNGVWRRPLSEVITSVEPSASKLPRAVSLGQNYPNPFNPSTMIHYVLPQRSNVTLTIHNILGQKVAELVNAEKEPGSYDAMFNASGLASGVYLYRIQVGSFVQTKKLLLLR